MADPNVNLYLPPPGSGNYGWRPALHNGSRFGDGRMSMPIVIALVLSIIVFILFLWFFLSPFVLNRTRPHAPPRPIDIEDAYFVDENIRTRPTHIQGPINDSINIYRAVNTQKPASPTLSVNSPPPAYTSHPTSPPKADGTLPFFSRLTPSKSAGSSQRSYQHQRSFRNMFGMQDVLRRSVSAPFLISKPIPHPEHPLPGPNIMAESQAESNKVSSAETTILRPCVAPHTVSDSILHPPAIYLPSQAVIHNVRDTLCRSFSENSSRFIPIGRFSAGFGRRTISERDISITSSKIGLAF